MSSPITVNILRKTSQKPVLVASLIPDVDIAAQIESIGKMKEHVDFIPEIRMDLMDRPSITYEETFLNTMDQQGINGIFTYRSEDILEAKKYYDEAILHSRVLIDLDYSIVSKLPNVWPRNRIIVSNHFKNGVMFRRLFDRALKFEGSAIKMASEFNSMEVLANIEYAKSIGKDRIISVVPQGESNKYMRIVTSLLINDFTYSFLTVPVAPGQYSLAETEEILSNIFS
jgi:3-dehydroquinate dehydratase